MLADRTKAAAIDAHDVWRKGGLRRRCHEVDRPAERRGAVGKGVAAFVDLDGAQGEGIDLVEITASIGGIHRKSVLKQLDAAEVKTARDARSAQGKAHFLTITLLHKDTGRIFENIA